VPISPELIEPLRQHFTGQDAERQAAGDAWEDRELVWSGPQGQPAVAGCRQTATTTATRGWHVK
jgi:hypothetical protein